MSERETFPVEQVHERFRTAVLRVKKLETSDRYLAAFIFGSLARGDATAASDLDVRVLVDDEHSCGALNHATVDGIKLDLTFLSFRQLEKQTQTEIEKGHRIPMVAESMIVFDKRGDLIRLREAAREARPRQCSREEQRDIQFGVLHANDKAERALTTDPLSALLVMHTSFSELLKTHYRSHSRWQVSDKRLLADLRDWEPGLAVLVERFVAALEPRFERQRCARKVRLALTATRKSRIEPARQHDREK
jgi:predicted nucleotidyltransferase